MYALALFCDHYSFSIDFASSFHAAMDLRQILESITNLKSDAEKLRERFIVLTDSVSETLRDKIGTIKSRRVLVLRNFRLLFLNTSKSFTLLFQRKKQPMLFDSKNALPI